MTLQSGVLHCSVLYPLGGRQGRWVMGAKEGFALPDTLDQFMERPTQHVVTVARPSGPYEITVAIDYRLPDHKPFLGGYRNRVTGVETHHVASQTALLPHQLGLDRLVDKYHRGCQTQITQPNEAQTSRDFGCQTPFYHQLVNETYPVVQAHPYVLAADEIAIRQVSALKIQRLTRGMFGRQLVARLKRELEEERKQIEQQEKEVQAALEHKRMVEIERRRHPRTAADFKVLYDELKAWHWQETQAINQGGHPEEERKRLLQELLAKETELLHTIDRMKIDARRQNSDAAHDRELDQLSKKKLWQMTSGEVVKVKTPNTVRAKELRNLYRALELPGVTTDERIEILLLLKQTVKEFKCQLTQDLITLIDREADLLNRGRPESSLKGLRQRIKTLFLQFCRTPEFNPEAATLRRLPEVV